VLFKISTPIQTFIFLIVLEN